MGPLLYHYSDMESEESIEPTYDQLRAIIEAVGFVYEVRRRRQPTAGYSRPSAPALRAAAFVMIMNSVCRSEG